MFGYSTLKPKKNKLEEHKSLGTVRDFCRAEIFLGNGTRIGVWAMPSLAHT